MKLIRLTARDFLSFANVDVPFSDTLTVITGPNGAGKTSIARAVDLVARSLRAHNTNDWTDVRLGYGDAGRRGAQQWRVALDVQFDDDEVAFLQSWVEGCVLYLIGENTDPDTSRMQQLALSHPDLGVAEMFARGSIEVDYDRRRRQPWRVSWISAANGQGDPPVRLRMDTNVAIADGLGESRPSYLSAVQNTILRSQQAASMPQGVLEAVPEGTFAPSVVEFARSGGIELTARRMGRDVEPEPVQRVFDALGLDLITSQKMVGFALVASYLVDRSLLVMDNVRLPPRRLWSVSDLANRPDLATGEGLALALFQGKNGSAAARDRFVQTREAFDQLTDKTMTLDLEAVPAPSDANQQVEGGRQIVLTPILSDGPFDVPLHLSGAGNTETALLSAVLAHDPPLLVLDEPGTNLSSSAQRRVLTAIRRRSANGRQTMLITHSSTLVPASLDAILRLGPASTGTTVRRLIDDPTVQTHADLLRHTPVRDALFASGVLLTEGISDEAMMRVWLATTDPTLEESGVLLMSVGSDSAFTAHMNVFDAIGIPWAALVDGPALKTRLHHYDPNAPTDDFDEAKAFWEQRGVYTLAEEFGTGDRQKHGELEAFLERADPELWRRLHGTKLKKAEAFARRTEVPSEVRDIWAKLLLQVARHRSTGPGHRHPTVKEADDGA